MLKIVFSSIREYLLVDKGKQHFIRGVRSSQMLSLSRVTSFFIQDRLAPKASKIFRLPNPYLHAEHQFIVSSVFKMSAFYVTAVFKGVRQLVHGRTQPGITPHSMHSHSFGAIYQEGFLRAFISRILVVICIAFIHDTFQTYG